MGSFLKDSSKFLQLLSSSMAPRSLCFLALVVTAVYTPSLLGFVGAPGPRQELQTQLQALESEKFTADDFGPRGSKNPNYERPPLPAGYGIRTGLSDLLKPLNS